MNRMITRAENNDAATKIMLLTAAATFLSDFIFSNKELLFSPVFSIVSFTGSDPGIRASSLFSSISEFYWFII